MHSNNNITKNERNENERKVDKLIFLMKLSFIFFLFSIKCTYILVISENIKIYT